MQHWWPRTVIHGCLAFETYKTTLGFAKMFCPSFNKKLTCILGSMKKKQKKQQKNL